MVVLIQREEVNEFKRGCKHLRFLTCQLALRTEQDLGKMIDSSVFLEPSPKSIFVDLKTMLVRATNQPIFCSTHSGPSPYD
jgi:hypothetical protein